jgi:hypothetical protein
MKVMLVVAAMVQLITCLAVPSLGNVGGQILGDLHMLTSVTPNNLGGTAGIAGSVHATLWWHCRKNKSEYLSEYLPACILHGVKPKIWSDVVPANKQPWRSRRSGSYVL